MNRIFFIISILISISLTSCDSLLNEKPLFTTLDSTQTGIGFVNKLVPSQKLNILDYLYFYNGGGVSTGDVNNDGLTDIYYVSNQGKNKLYLNKGNFKFEDITDKAGVEGFSDWQTGSTMADVNGDGLLDIYVCAVGNFRGLEGANELYINNGPGPDGVPTFTEKAADYGLDFTGFSTQAAFFDYDHDGDLDCYLLNHAVHTSRSYDRVSTRTLRSNAAGDYLYRNMSVEQGAGNGRAASRGDGGGSTNPSQPGQPLREAALQSLPFKDVSQQAGIYGAAMGYGLGIAVADLNNDGWEDLYVSNDFHEDDYYYINNQDGTFTESVKGAFQHTSRFSMGTDIADVNADGFADVVSLDMYPEDETVEKSSAGEDPLDIYQYKLAFGYMNQYSRNCLQLNLSGQKFIDIAPLAGVAATDWSWSPLLADYDNDGIKDLFITNGIAHRPNNLDYIKFASDDSLRYAMETSSALDERAIKLMPEGKVHNYLYRGTPALRFEDKSEAWGMNVPNCANGAAYADLDNDGDLDLVTNNIDEPASIYRNEADKLFPENQHLTVRLKGSGPNTFGVGAKVILKYADTVQVQQLMPTRGFESSVAPELLFGLGTRQTIDSVIVIWPSMKREVRTQVKAGQTLTLNQTDATLDATNYHYTAPPAAPLFTNVPDSLPYRHRENSQYYDFVRESLMPFKISTEGPKLAVGDVNGDGLADVYTGGAKWQPGTLLLQQPGGRFSTMPQPDFVRDSTYEDVDAALFDADGDRDLDLYVVSGGNEYYDDMPQQYDRLYLNDGRGHFTRQEKALPPMPDNKSCVRPFDIDADGDLDLFVGGRVVGYGYGKTPRSYLLINNGKGVFTDQTDQLSPALRRVGMVTDAVWTDTDGDKKADLVVVGDWMPVRVFKNQNGKLTEAKTAFADDVPMNGFYQCVVAADFDQDGDADLVVGNLGTNTKLRKTPDSRLRMLVKDIDNNQTTEQVIAYNRGDTWYPLAMKDELGKQMPGIINKRFTDYESFAGKPLDEVFEGNELDGAEEREVNQFASLYLENRGGGQFEAYELPMLAQVSKLFTLLPYDIDADGDLDLLGGGNFYGSSMYQGRYDASLGLVLRNDTRTSASQTTPGESTPGTLFTALSPLETGFILNGEIRDLRPLPTPTGTWLLATRNGAGVQTLRAIGR
jgi:enediyne biosynthesis protein E4